jgi:hypothetical protein
MFVAFTGRKQSGKDSSANFLEDMEPDLERLRFAGPLKEMMATLLMEMGMDEEQAWEHIDGSLKEAPLKLLQGQSVRYAMQKLGTEWRNFFGDNLWSDIIAQQVDDALAAESDVIITDLRFLHEETFVRDRNGLVVRTRRYGQGAPTDMHPSEVEMEKITPDMTLWNHGTLGDFEDVIAISSAVWRGVTPNLAGAIEILPDIMAG